MTSKVKNIIIFAIVAVILVLIYIFFIKKAPEENGLVSTSGSTVVPSTDTSDEGSSVTREFLSILLNVKNIKLDDSIFSDIAFSTLRDSSIVLTPDGTEGRPNPFAPIGSDSAATPAPATPLAPSSSGASPASAPTLGGGPAGSTSN